MFLPLDHISSQKESPFGRMAFECEALFTPTYFFKKEVVNGKNESKSNV